MGNKPLLMKIPQNACLPENMRGVSDPAKMWDKDKIGDKIQNAMCGANLTLPTRQLTFLTF